MKIASDNFFTIKAWMITELGLKGVERDVYAIIYGFSQDGECWFTGSRQYLCDFTLSTKRTIDSALQNLVEKGLIIKSSEKINNVLFNKYKINRNVVDCATGAKIAPGMQNDNFNENNDDVEIAPPVQKLHGGGAKITPNNIEDNILNDKLINDKSRESRACEDESSMPFKNGELMDEENDEKNNTMPTHRKTPTKYPSNDTSHEARTEMREMVSERGLDPFTYQHMHHLVQKLYYDKVFTPEECLALSDKLNELDKEHWYMTVAKAFSYSLDKSKSKKIKSRVGYLLKIIEKNVEQIEYNESGEPERKADELRKTFENIKNGKLATSS